jgi:hypothetical protein
VAPVGCAFQELVQLGECAVTVSDGVLVHLGEPIDIGGGLESLRRGADGDAGIRRLYVGLGLDSDRRRRGPFRKPPRYPARAFPLVVVRLGTGYARFRSSGLMPRRS